MRGRVKYSDFTFSHSTGRSYGLHSGFCPHWKRPKTGIFVHLHIILKFYGSLKPPSPRPNGTEHQSTVSQSRGTVTQTHKETVYKSSEFSGLNKWISKEIQEIVTRNLAAPSFTLKSHFKLGEGQEWEWIGKCKCYHLERLGHSIFKVTT